MKRQHRKINGSERGERKSVRESLERESVCVCVRTAGLMMDQIAKRKKKGRPLKSDLAKRLPKPSPTAEPEPDLRRWSVRYTFIDYDDYIDDEYDFDDEEEDEDERRKAKKLKLVVTLDQEARGEHALDNSASTSEEESGERKPLRSSGGGGGMRMQRRLVAMTMRRY